MSHRLFTGLSPALILLGVGVLSQPAWSDVVEGTYLFDNNFNAQQGGAPALTSVDPGAVGQFVTDTVFGQSQTVFQYGGSASPPADQGGLTLDTSGLLPSTTSYSVEMVFEYQTTDTGWRRILDVSNRASDNGFYVNPANNLDIYPTSGSGTTDFTNNAYHYVVLTDNAGTDTVYLDGNQEFSVASTTMDNTGNLLTFFLDNTAGGGQGEWAPGRVALIRVSDGALTSDEVTQNYAALQGTSAVPEPSMMLLLAAAMVGLVAHRRFRVAKRVS